MDAAEQCSCRNMPTYPQATNLCVSISIEEKLHNRLDLTYNFLLNSSQDLALSWDSIAIISSILPLCNVSIEFHSGSEQFLYADTDADEQSLEKFSHPETKFIFSGLRKLSLLGLVGNIKAWRNQILQIILNSPDLEYLALSLSDDSQLETEYEIGEESSDDLSHNTDMFQWLCREYKEATGRLLQFKATKFDYDTFSHKIAVTGWATHDGLAPVYIWFEVEGPFSQGLEAFPMSDIGALLHGKMVEPSLNN